MLFITYSSYTLLYAVKFIKTIGSFSPFDVKSLIEFKIVLNVTNRIEIGLICYQQKACNFCQVKQFVLKGKKR